MAIITLSRQSGSFGDEIGMMIARRIGYTYFDRKEIEHRIIEKGFPEDRFKLYDERKPGFFASYAKTRDEYLNYLSMVVLEMAQENNCVIMGRGAFLLLSDVPNHIALRFVSTDAARSEHIKELLHIEDDKVALKTLRASDKRQRGFYKSYFDYDLLDPSRIHAIINTATMPTEIVAEMISVGVAQNVPASVEQAGEERVKELIIAQKVANKLVFEHKLAIDRLWVDVHGSVLTLRGITASSAIVERAVTIINAEFPAYEVRPEVRSVQDFHNNAKRLLADKVKHGDR